MPRSKEIPVHVIACAGLVRKGDQVLLVHSDHRGWEFPGGQMEQGETPYQAVLREILEESGVTAKVVKLVGIYSSLSKRLGYGPWEGKIHPPVLNLDFVCDYVSGEPKVSDETDAARFVSRQEALNMVTYPSYIDRLQNMLDEPDVPVFKAGWKDAQGDIHWFDAESPQDSEQIARITRYEAMLDEASALLSADPDSDRLPSLVQDLEAYYTSDTWKQDYADDEAGLLPPFLKRGVLSQDAIYDLLTTWQDQKNK